MYASIDVVVTSAICALAFNAFREYEDTYDYFMEGQYELNNDSQRMLTEMAVGMSMLVMVKADRDTG